jgi:hypothetical protein
MASLTTIVLLWHHSAPKSSSTKSQHNGSHGLRMGAMAGMLAMPWSTTTAIKSLLLSQRPQESMRQWNSSHVSATCHAHPQPMQLALQHAHSSMYCSILHLQRPLRDLATNSVKPYTSLPPSSNKPSTINRPATSRSRSISEGGSVSSEGDGPEPNAYSVITPLLPHSR